MRRVVPAAMACALASCASVGPPSLRGYFTWGHEVESFVACGSTRAYWVVGEASTLDTLRRQAEARIVAGDGPYRPVYVEITALEEPRAVDGFAADYVGVLRITRLHKVLAVAPASCSTPPGH